MKQSMGFRSTVCILAPALTSLLLISNASATQHQNVRRILEDFADPSERIPHRGAPDGWRDRVEAIIRELREHWSTEAGEYIIPEIVASASAGGSESLFRGLSFLLAFYPQWLSDQEQLLLRTLCEEDIRRGRSTVATYRLWGITLAEDLPALAPLIRRMAREDDDELTYHLFEALRVAIERAAVLQVARDDADANIDGTAFDQVLNVLRQRRERFQERAELIERWERTLVENLLRHHVQLARRVDESQRPYDQGMVDRMHSLFEMLKGYTPLPHLLPSFIIALPESLQPHFRGLLIEWMADLSRNERGAARGQVDVRSRLEGAILETLARIGNKDDVGLFRDYLKQLPVEQVSNIGPIIAMLGRFGTLDDLDLLRARYASVSEWAESQKAAGLPTPDHHIRFMKERLDELSNGTGVRT